MFLGFQSPFWSHFITCISHTMNKNPTNTTMASTKFVTMVKRNVGKIISILAYVFLEWLLIVFLLCNSFFAYLIAKFALYFGLKPPCPWCSRVDHLLEPARITDPFRSLVCDAHANVISKLTFCSIHKKLVEFESLCKECLCSQPKCDEIQSKCGCCERMCSAVVQDRADFAVQNDSEIKEIEEKANEGGDSGGSECEQQVLSDTGSFCLRETADEEDSNEDEETEKSKENIDDTEKDVEKGNGEEMRMGMVQKDEVAVAESENITDKKKIDISIKEGDTYPIERRIDHLLLLAENKELLENDSFHGSLVCRMECEHDAFHTIQTLKSNLETEQKAKNDLYAELEAERNAAAVAANQTMAMITRLQEEKASMQMEALQYQRVMEEQAEYDHEALRLLNELVHKREREKEELEKELNVYRERVAEYEIKEKAIVMVGKCENENSSTDAISNDLNHQYSEEDKENYLIECSKEWGELEDSLQELEEERLSIMKQLRYLEEKLYESEKEEPVDPNADLCSHEVNLVPCCFSTDPTSEDQPKTMASVARRLLDLVDSEDRETEEDEEEALISKRETLNGSEKLAIVKEMDHVYGRLHALEADTEFLRHCIATVSKGNTGANLLQEILQHMKELRSAEVCF